MLKRFFALGSLISALMVLALAMLLKGCLTPVLKPSTPEEKPEPEEIHYSIAPSLPPTPKAYPESIFVIPRDEIEYYESLPDVDVDQMVISRHNQRLATHIRRDFCEALTWIPDKTKEYCLNGEQFSFDRFVMMLDTGCNIHEKGECITDDSAHSAQVEWENRPYFYIDFNTYTEPK